MTRSDQARNPLTQALLDTIAIARARASQIHDLRMALRVAVTMLAEQNDELDRLRDRYHRLLDERRHERQRAA